MGDNHDRASVGATRSILEGKLSNRSLVLVGGGVYNHAAAVTSKSLGRKSEESTAANGMLSLGMAAQVAAAASSSGKRERKRVGGNGVFGSISNKKRKKILRQILEKQSTRNSELKANDVVVAEEDAASSQEKQSQNEKVKGKEYQSGATLTDTHVKVGTIIETLHEMWINYMHQLLSPIMEANDNSTLATMDSPLLAMENRKRISLLLTTAEHVGMPATIVDCPSRRHLIRARCMVVNETKETWTVAMIMAGKQNANLAKEKSEKLHKVGSSNNTQKIQSHSWKIVLVPKRGTVLEVDLQWPDGSAQIGTGKSYVTVRLET